MRGQESSYRTAEIQQEKKGHGGHTLKGDQHKGKAVCIPKGTGGESTTFFFYDLSMSMTDDCSQKRNEMKCSYKHLILGAEAFKEKC